MPTRPRPTIVGPGAVLSTRPRPTIVGPEAVNHATPPDHCRTRGHSFRQPGGICARRATCSRTVAEGRTEAGEPSATGKQQKQGSHGRPPQEPPAKGRRRRPSRANEARPAGRRRNPQERKAPEGQARRPTEEPGQEAAKPRTDPGGAPRGAKPDGRTDQQAQTRAGPKRPQRGPGRKGRRPTGRGGANFNTHNAPLSGLPSRAVTRSTCGNAEPHPRSPARSRR